MGSLPKRHVQFFYDVISPYAWIGFEVICRYREKWNLNLEFRPCFLSGIMEESGNKPPATVPAKGAYIAGKDLPRLSKHFAIPVKPPSNPAESIFQGTISLAALRFLAALSMESPNKVEDVTRQLFLRVFHYDVPINKPECIAEAATAAGLNHAQIQRLLQKSTTPEAKELVKKNTEDALQAGAFGAPTFLVTNTQTNEDEMVFGSDRFPIIADLLGVKYEGPLIEKSKIKIDTKARL